MKDTTLIINTTLDVQQRLHQLQAWFDDWEVEDQHLTQRIQALNPYEPLDLQLGTQLTRWQQRMRLKLIQIPLEIDPEIVQSVGYETLRRMMVQQFATLSPQQKHLWLHNFLFILTPKLRLLNDKISNILNYRALGQQRNFLLGGPSGMGKSTYLDWLTLHHSATVQSERNHVPIVKIDAPVSNHTPKPLFQRLLLEYGMTYIASQNEEHLLMALILIAKQCGTELLIVDEIEHITRPIIRRRLLEISNLTHGIPIICASCHPLVWVQGDTEIAGRWNDYFELEQYVGTPLRQLLAFLELLLPFTQDSFLALDELPDGSLGPAFHIEKWTGGILRDIMILIVDATQRAIDTQSPALTVALLQAAWDDIQAHPVTDFLVIARQRLGASA